jgi:hypothetical protein
MLGLIQQSHYQLVLTYQVSTLTFKAEYYQIQIAYVRTPVFPHFLVTGTPCPTTHYWLLSWVGEESFVQRHPDWFTSVQRHYCQITVIRQGSPAGCNPSLQRFFAAAYRSDSNFAKDLALHLVSHG